MKIPTSNPAVSLLQTTTIAWCVALFVSVTTTNAVEVPIGVVVYTSQGSSYPEALEFISLNKASATFSVAVRSDGRKVEIRNTGIVLVAEYPPAAPETATTSKAAALLPQIEAVLRRYPREQYRDVHSKLTPLVAKWKAAQTAAVAQQPAKAPPGAPPAGTVIKTLDGHTYEDVTVTKVDPDALSFMHSAGSATVDFETLPPDLRAKHNYDPAKAAPAREARKQSATTIAAANAKAMEVAAKQDAAKQAAQAGQAEKKAKAGSGARNFNDLMRAYRITPENDAIAVTKYEKDRFYFIGGGAQQPFVVAQVTGDLILAADVTKKPWAVLTFANPSAIANVRIDKGQYAMAVGKFVELRSLTMTNGAESRFPVFECVGFQSMGTADNAFINTEER